MDQFACSCPNMALKSMNHSVDRLAYRHQFIIVSNLRTNVEWLSATVVVKPRQLIQRLSAILVFLSTIFSGKQPLLYRLRETKLPPSPWFCASTDDQRPLKTPAVQRAPRVVLMADVIMQGVYSATFLPMLIPLKTLRNFSKLHLKIYSG